jgi:hypothetical protein
VHRDLAWALNSRPSGPASSRRPCAAPTGRLAVITAVNSDGTLAASGIPSIRRLSRFTDPVVGDTIVISQNSLGNWVALGKLATSANEWTPLPLASGFTAVSGYFAPAYRAVGGREVQLRGSANKSTTLVSGDVWAVLPAGVRPTADLDIVMGMTHGTNGTNFGACRGIIRAATGNIEYRGPSVSHPRLPLPDVLLDQLKGRPHGHRRLRAGHQHRRPGHRPQR